MLPITAAGNEAIDLGNPTSDDTSPDFPVWTAHHRDVTNACICVSADSEGVTVVSSTGPTTRKAYYSNYGTEQTDVRRSRLHRSRLLLVLPVPPGHVHGSPACCRGRSPDRQQVQRR